jgi:hypothetical protein
MSEPREIPDLPVLGAIKTIYFTLCVLLFVAGLVAPTIWKTYLSSRNAYIETTNLPEGYSVLTCTKPEVTDLTASASLPVTIPLSAGCIHGPIILPPHTWIQATLGGPGEWVAVDGEKGLSKVVYWTPEQDGNLGGVLAGSQKIGIEGKGALTITRDFVKSPQEPARNEQPEHQAVTRAAIQNQLPSQSAPTVTQPPSPPAYKITPVEPIPPNGRTISFVMQECHRDSDHVVCVMKCLNNTDAIVNQIDTVFESAVDDEGYSLPDEGGFARFSLMPGVPIKAAFHLREPHAGATKVSIQMRWDSDSLMDGIHQLAFPNIPIQ